MWLAALSASLALNVSPFNISAGRADRALLDFAHQAKFTLLFPAVPVGLVQTVAVSGNLQPSKALELMLKGTNLTYEFVTPNSVAVFPAPLSLSSEKPTKRPSDKHTDKTINANANTSTNHRNQDRPADHLPLGEQEHQCSCLSFPGLSDTPWCDDGESLQYRPQECRNPTHEGGR